MALQNHQNIHLTHDGPVTIATGKNRKSTNWTNQTIQWSQLVNKVIKTKRTDETFADYLAMPKEQQDEIKDKGGFVGGTVNNGRRGRNDIECRSVIALDADHATDIGAILGQLDMFFECACVWYTTHKHQASKPRFRLLIPLTKEVTPEQYEAISRKVASVLDIEAFDDTTYEPNRLMYWPTTAKDGDFEANYVDAEWLNPDTVLTMFKDWRDYAEWPVSSRQTKEITERKTKQQDPTTKKGIVGAFCRTFDIHEAITEFLGHVYEETENGRYSYIEGTTSNGVATFEDKYSFSFHSTDPTAGSLCNAFDVVRIHLFGELDKEAAKHTAGDKLPSFQAMSEFARNNESVKLTLVQEMLPEFEELPDDDKDWLKMLDIDKRLGLKDTFQNYLLILQHDPRLKEKLATDDFAHRYVVLGDLPWRELGHDRFWKNSDDAELRGYFETTYGTVSRNKTSDALDAVFARRRFHPVREYLSGLMWDGTERVDKLLIDYLGADDTAFNRAVSRKTLCAATARIMQPGIKFDYMLVLIGTQGIGKSSLFSKLAGKWFSDSLTTVQNKEAYEQLQGVWVIEMGELAATRKADVESLKHFLSKQTDSFRVAYGKHVSEFPRQCIFVGTTNDREFLKDRTGNRRFWPVNVTGMGARNIWTDLSQYEIDQIWAEALHKWQEGEPLYLDRDMEEEARRIQESHTEESPLYGMIQEFLNRKLPDNWNELGIYERRQYLNDDLSPEGTIERERVCSLEIWCELLGGDPKRFPAPDRREINDVLRRMPGWKGRYRMRFGDRYGVQNGYQKDKN